MTLFINSYILAAAAVILLVYRFVVHPALLSPLAKIPNAHWSAPFSRLWVLSLRFGHKENRTLRAAHRRLGPVIRVAPNELSVDGVDCVRTVYQGGFDKGSWYSVFDNYGSVAIIESLNCLRYSLTWLKGSVHVFDWSVARAFTEEADDIQCLLQVLPPAITRVLKPGSYHFV